MENESDNSNLSEVEDVSDDFESVELTDIQEVLDSSDSQNDDITESTEDNQEKGDEFEITDWRGYPEGPKPEGPFRILEGEEYEAARKLANQTNTELHAKDPSLDGLEIHEVKPVKFGGSPSDLGNKIAITPEEHAKYTTWWNNYLKNKG